MDPRLIVVRDQFALRNLSDEALRRIAPTLIEAQKVIIAEIEAALGTGDRPELSWYLTRRKESLAIIDRQLLEVAARLDDLLPDAMAAAYRQGAANAQQYLDAVTPDTELQQQELLTRTGPEPRPYVTPAITEEQLRAVVRGPGFRSLPGLIEDAAGLGEQSIAYRWAGVNAQALRQRLEGGFLLSKSNSEILADVRGYMEGASRAQMEAIVRTSMATASQSAHDAFYAANEDALGDADGNRYRWDASLDSRVCSICAPLDGMKYKSREAVPRFPAHYSCRCRVLPCTPISDELDPGLSSFLEQTAVQYDKKGKRLPPPDGYNKKAGDAAYARPMKINGKQVWVRRRDIPGVTSVGKMLQLANDESVLSVLGSRARLERFRMLTRKGGQWRSDPQGAVIELLRPSGLPAGATRRLRTPARST